MPPLIKTGFQNIMQRDGWGGGGARGHTHTYTHTHVHTYTRTHLLAIVTASEVIGPSGLAAF